MKFELGENIFCNVIFDLILNLFRYKERTQTYGIIQYVYHVKCQAHIMILVKYIQFRTIFIAS